jgi:GWxTD domain-containing protein
MSVRVESGALPAAVVAAAVLAGFIAACSRAPKIKGDAEAEAFFERAQLVMTREDLDIFRALPDREARAEFMADFWRMRDPNPETEANEALEEFERRVAFANKWFSRFDPIRGRDVEGKSHPETGCVSDRGRVYVLLGPPQRIQFMSPDLESGDMRIPFFRKVTDEQEFSTEFWHYDRLRIDVEFERSASGRWDLWPSSGVAERLDEAKLKLIEDHYRYASTKVLAFTAKYDGQAFRLEVPAEGVDFDDEWKACLEVTVNVYRDGQRVDRVGTTERLDWSADEPAEVRTVSIEIPCDLAEKGDHVFEVIVEDRGASCFSKRRALIRSKAN